MLKTFYELKSMNTKYIKIIITLFFFIISFNLFAQREGVIIGNVKDMYTLQSIPGVSIEISGLQGGTVTDSVGN